MVQPCESNIELDQKSSTDSITELKGYSYWEILSNKLCRKNKSKRAEEIDRCSKMLPRLLSIERIVNSS